MSKPYVFVVDDDQVVRVNIVKKLSRLNCHVCAFGSGEALMEFFVNQENEPDVIVLDFKMKGMDGIETLSAIREISSVPAVILTAYEGCVDLDKVSKLGSCEVMTKTVDLDNLGAIVNGVVALKKIR